MQGYRLLSKRKHTCFATFLTYCLTYLFLLHTKGSVFPCALMSPKASSYVADVVNDPNS